ncbi:carbohydrate ABC transporter permease [Pseudonocardia sp. TRM90224]|uniref:carbohydrate ABC transporter permease n=1 Tax=Pseudonocardia sp. TRM90224 TaxID=2812678 RepID=UPI001E383543|nr:sugar ABC transporter permease [Pseudonocardia sp. TRM90224]
MGVQTRPPFEGEPPGIAPRERKTARLGRHLPLIAVAPAALAILAVFGYPTFDGIRLSFSDWLGFGEPDWVGAANYVSALSSPDMWHSLWVTLVFSVGTSFGIVAIGSVLAATISMGAPGSKFYRVVWYLPSIAPGTAVAVLWSTGFQPDFGFVNGVLGALGLGDNHAWLADSSTAIFPTIFVSIWSGVGFSFLLLLGAMEQIPVSVYEAAGLDGASDTQKFFHITIPMIRPVLVTCSLLQFIWAANGFAMLWGMTQGGPGTATQTLPLLVYTKAFGLAEYGVASAMAVISGVLLLGVGIVSLRLSRSQQAGGL